MSKNLPIAIILVLISISAGATPCMSQRVGFGFEDCGTVDKKMIVTTPEIYAGNQKYLIEDNNSGEVIATKLCLFFGGRALVGFTATDAGYGQQWTDLAELSPKDGSFLKIGSYEFKFDTLTCSL